MRRLVFLLPLSLFLFACPPPITTADGGIFTVGPEGGLFIDTAHGVGLEVPKGALQTESIITVTVIDTGIPEVPNRKRISFGYRLSPSTLKFGSPVKLFLPWLDERIPKGVDPGTFDMRRQTQMDPYLALPGTITHTDFKSVEAQTDKLGLFWVTSPISANVATLKVTPEQVALNVGDTQQFTAEVKDPTGAILEAEVKWTAVAPRIGSITDGADGGGLFTAKAPGIATVTARAGMQSATAEVRVRGTAVGPSTFVHENPFPTGNDLWGGAVSAIGTAFVGGNGTVLIKDGSNNWTRAFSAPGIVLKGIAGTSLQNAVAVGSLGTNGILVELSGNAPKVTPFTSANPQHLWFDGTHGMAVGTGNDVLVRRGTTWVKEYNPSFEPLLAVVGDGMGGFVVLGGQGSLYKYDPMTQRWNSLYQTQLAVLLTAGALVGNNGSEAWACGGNKVWHFQSNTWTAINMPATPNLTEATALGLVDGRIVIGGRVNKAGWAEIYDPNATSSDAGVDPDGGTPLVGWTVLPLRTPQIPRGFFGLGPLSVTAYLVGDFGSVYRYEMGTLVEESRGFYGDVSSVATVGNDVFAAVNECANSNCSAFTPSVYKRTAPGVFEKVGMTQPFGGFAWALTAKSADDVVVSIASPNGMSPSVYFWDGASWGVTQFSGGVTGALLNLKYCGANLFGVGVGGAWYRGGPTLLTRQPALTQGNLWGFHCPNENELWASGDGVLFSREGGASWAARDTMGVQQAGWRAVWSPGQGEAFAFGDARFGVYWDTTELKVLDGPGGTLPDIIHGLWGSTIDNLYAVGLTTTPVSFGLGLRFDGADWRMIDMGSQRDVTAIDGTTNTNVWIGTKGGGILRGVTVP